MNSFAVISGLRTFSPLLLTGLALIIGVAIDVAEDLAWHDQHRIEQAVLLSLTAIGGLTFWQKSFSVSFSLLPLWARLAFCLAFGLGLVSAVASTYPRFALLEWATLLLLLGMVLLLAMKARIIDGSFDVWSTRILMTLAVVISLKILAGYLAAITTKVQLDSIMLFEGTFSNRRFFGQVASMLVPILAYPLLRGGLTRGTQAALYALLAVWWMLVIVSGTRGTWLALAIAASILAIFSLRTCAGWLRVQAFSLGLGGLLFAALFVWLPVSGGLDTSIENRMINPATLSGREVLWTLTWTQIQAHPWLGIGPMHLAAIRNDVGAHPHNSVLQLVAEWGIPAALAFILPVVVGMLHLLASLRQTPASPNVLLVCLTASLLAAATQSMVDGVIVIPYTQTLLVLVAGWTLGVYLRSVTVVPAADESLTMRVAVSVVSMFALVSLLNGVFPEVMNRVEMTQSYADTGKLIPPRYWGVGWIP